jgi:hypothetical protein
VHVSGTGIWATQDDGSALPLLGLESELGVEHLPGNLAHLRENRAGRRRNAMEIGRLQDILDTTFAPLREALDDEVMVHGVPPDAKVYELGSHQETPWTTDLQSEGTPGGEQPVDWVKVNVLY